MQPEPDRPVDRDGAAPAEESGDNPVMSEPRPAGMVTGAGMSSPAAAAAQRSTERLVVAEVACMVITTIGVFLGFVPLVLAGFILSVVAVVLA